MWIIMDTAVVNIIYSLTCHDRVTPPDDSTDEVSLSRPIRSVEAGRLQPEAVFSCVVEKLWTRK